MYVCSYPFNLVKIVTPYSISFDFLVGLWWDSEIEILGPLLLGYDFKAGCTLDVVI